MPRQDGVQVQSAPEGGTGGDPASERRRYFRIRDQVALKYQAISEPEYAEGLRDILESPPGLMSLANTFAVNTRHMAPTLRRIREFHPELCRYLGMVNEKLDLLARAFSIAESDMAGWPTQTVCLSAGGISFEAQTPIGVGTHAKATLVMFPSLVQVIALGKVVRCRPIAQGTVQYRIGFEFTQINEADRELIIQHIVQRQLSRLRARRGVAEQARSVSLRMSP
ncbi:MAG: PilZ domain-containing protein [Gammaproteobacteria bacterium]